METPTKLTENWLTRKPQALALERSLFLVFVLFASSFLFWTGILGADQWMPASPYQVFREHQYWRLWTGLFAHADAGHLLSNIFLFLPFSYFLLGHFTPVLFPALGILLGGLINFLVLKSMPEQSSVIGISGVVFWMGAVWLYLFLLIDRRESFRRRLAKVLFISVVLFIPETYKPETSYLSHFIGYVLGVLSAFAFYALRRREILAAEVYEKIEEEASPEFWSGPGTLGKEQGPEDQQNSDQGGQPDPSAKNRNSRRVDGNIDHARQDIQLCTESGKACQPV